MADELCITSVGHRLVVSKAVFNLQEAATAALVQKLLLEDRMLQAPVSGTAVAALPPSANRKSLLVMVEMLVKDGAITERRPSPRELDRAKVQLVGALGSGRYGDVQKAQLEEGRRRTIVAVKSVKGGSPDTETTALLREAALMSQVSSHPNLVPLLGVVTSTPGEPLVVVKFCANGDLRSYLQAQKSLDARFKLQVALEIARGMAHLVVHRLVHRDLAARNVLLDSHRRALIADLGLSRRSGSSAGTEEAGVDEQQGDYYRMSVSSTQTAMPVRWTAPEAVVSGRFSELTDVWSYAITLIELYTEGERPYSGMKNAVVQSQVTMGYRMPKPAKCPPEVFSLISQCWAANDSNRPTFRSVVVTLGGILPAGAGAPAAAALPAGTGAPAAAALPARADDDESEYEIPVLQKAADRQATNDIKAERFVAQALHRRMLLDSQESQEPDYAEAEDCVYDATSDLPGEFENLDAVPAEGFTPHDMLADSDASRVEKWLQIVVDRREAEKYLRDNGMQEGSCKSTYRPCHALCHCTSCTATFYTALSAWSYHQILFDVAQWSRGIRPEATSYRSSLRNNLAIFNSRSRKRSLNHGRVRLS